MTKVSTFEKTKHLLTQLLDAYGDELPATAWASEEDRFKELLVCMLHQLHPTQPISNIRGALDFFHQLNLFSPKVLTTLGSEQDSVTVMRYILEKHNYTTDEALAAISLLQHTCQAIGTEHDFKLQHLLHVHFRVMLSGLEKQFQHTGLAADQIRYGLIHWLQNAMNAPLSLADKSIESFCIEHEIDTKDLFQAADDLNINYAVIDDLLALSHPFSKNQIV